MAQVNDYPEHVSTVNAHVYSKSSSGLFAVPSRLEGANSLPEATDDASGLRSVEDLPEPVEPFVGERAIGTPEIASEALDGSSFDGDSFDEDAKTLVGGGMAPAFRHRPAAFTPLRLTRRRDAWVQDLPAAARHVLENAQGMVPSWPIIPRFEGAIAKPKQTIPSLTRRPIASIL